MDTLSIKGMKFRGYHGLHPHEKEEGNDFEVDVLLKADLSKAGASDDISDTPDYSRIEALTKKIMEGESADTIEHLAFKIGNKISGTFPRVQQFEVRLRKLNPPLDTPTDHTEVRMSWPR